MQNTQVILKKRPIGFPEKNTWEWVDSDLPSLADGQFLIETHYISLDPAMRGWLNDAKSYIPPVQIGEVMRCGGVGKIIASKNEHFKENQYVYGTTGVQKYCISDGRGWVVVNPDIAPLPTFLGALGMPGFTAYFGLLDVGLPKEGDTVVVSGAAGAVGSIVGQIAKIKGCRVVGIAGGEEKCRQVCELYGFDACIDYKQGNLKQALREHCPKGVDVYFDNVGGEMLDTVLAQIARGARIVICGAISQYNNKERVQGPANYLSLLVNGARMEGFVVMHFAKRYGEAAMQLGQWIAEGRIKTKEDIDLGIENFYESFCKLFTGENKGKMVLQVKQ